MRALETVPSLADVLFSFRGRVQRKTYWEVLWGLTLINLVVYFSIASLIAPIKNPTEAAQAILFLVCLGVPSFWVSIAIQVKRWHDIGLSGWMALTNIIAPVTLILGFIPGKRGDNKYGEDPLNYLRTHMTKAQCWTANLVSGGCFFLILGELVLFRLNERSNQALVLTQNQLNRAQQMHTTIQNLAVRIAQAGRIDPALRAVLTRQDLKVNLTAEMQANPMP